MARLFLSYAREDGDKAKLLAGALERSGHDVWWDRHIRGGTEYSEEIERALDRAEAVIVLWSKASVKSAWVRDEAAAGRDSGRLLPVLLDAVSPPMGFRQYQVVDLSDWTNQKRSQRYDDLTDAIESTASGGNVPPRPDPVSATTTAARKPSTRPERWKYPALAAGLVVAVAIMAVASGWFFRGDAPATRHLAQSVAAGAVPATVDVEDRSIAVLPLVNASNDPDQQFFSDGLSENLIDSLSRFDGLKVIGRTSAFQFRDSKDDSAIIGRKLGVAYLLNGSVQRASGVVRIRASLIKAVDGSTLWSEHYDRPYQNLFALQDEIAQAVAGALRVKLSSPGTSAKQDDRPPSGSIEAYNAYLQGLKYWHDEKWAEAVEYMGKAVQLDPGYAVAWAHLSGSLSTDAVFGSEPPAVAREQMRKSRVAASTALELAPGLGSAHAALAYVQFYGFDSRGALADCRRAVQLAPDDGRVLNGCGFVLAGIGKLREATRLRERVLSIEPLYGVNHGQYAKLLMATGRLDEAEKYLRISEGLWRPNPHMHLVAAVLRGDASAALKIATQAPAGKRELYMALAAQIGPDRAAADTTLAIVLQDKATTKSHAFEIAQIYALRGEVGPAVQWLRQAPTAEILFLLTDPLILHLRDDPVFIAFCKTVGLPPPSESEALSIDQIRVLRSNHSAGS